MPIAPGSQARKLWQRELSSDEKQNFRWGGGKELPDEVVIEVVNAIATYRNECASIEAGIDLAHHFTIAAKQACECYDLQSCDINEVVEHVGRSLKSTFDGLHDELH